MAGKWSSYPFVCCMLTVLLPTAGSAEVQKTCIETCFTPSVEVVTDCNTTVNELDLYGVKGVCNRHCDYVVVSVCNKTGNCRQTSLEVPSSPSFLNSKFKAITLQWENSKSASRLVSMYVLEVKSNRTSKGPLEILPFASKYHFINVTNNTKFTTFTVKELPPETSYKFRVASFGPDWISDYSDWSAWYSTNSTCKRTTGDVTTHFGFLGPSKNARVNFPCPVSQLKLNVSLKIRDKKPVVLDATLHLKYPPNIHELKDKVSVRITVKLLKHEDPSIQDVCQFHHADDFTETFPVGKMRWHSINLFNVGESTLKKSIHFGCKYEVKVEAVNILGQVPPNSFETTSVFWIPECLEGARSCPLSQRSINVNDDVESRHIGIKISEDSNGKYTTKISWNIEAWKNLPKVEFFHITVENWPAASGRYYHNKDVTAVDVTSQYHSSAFNMSETEENKFYRVVVRAYHGKNCIHDIIERETFQIIKPCNGGCNPNATCLPKNTFDGSAQCKCNKGFTGNGTFCTVAIKNPSATKGGKKGVNAIAIVVPIMLALALALCVGALLWKRKQKRKRMARELFIEIQTSTIPSSSSGSNLYRHLPSTRGRSGNNFPEKDVEPVDDREVNLIYVPQEIQDAISRGLTDGYEFNAELLMLGNCLGKGAFGNVYYADAQTIGTDPGWTPVAVKTLNEHTSNTYVESFLEEIEVMKKLGQHENVIKMLGCCTITMPICLILEYAPHGNLRSYLRTLRSKLEENISIRPSSEEYDLKKTVSCEEQFEKSGGDTNPPKKGVPEAEMPPAKEPVTDFLAIDGVIESNELESFALQIANGMAYVAGLGIVHRDLAARNILIGHDRVLKISDFGLSKEGVYVKTTRGKIPLRWLSAEAIRERSYSSASDVWAFGIVLWEICTLGGFPYPSISDRDLLKFLEKGNRMEKPSNCTSEIYKVMLDCWSYLPADRPSFEVLRDLLWKLKNNENPYVNVDPLQDFPPVNEGSFECDSEEEMTPDDLISADPQTNAESPDDNGENKETNEGTPNHGFRSLDNPGDVEGSGESFPDDKDTILKTELKDNVSNPSS